MMSQLFKRIITKYLSFLDLMHSNFYELIDFDKKLQRIK